MQCCTKHKHKHIRFCKEAAGVARDRIKARVDYCPYRYSGLRAFMKEERRSRGRGSGWGKSATKPQKAFHALFQDFLFFLGSPPEKLRQYQGLLGSPFPKAQSVTSCLRAPRSEDPIPHRRMRVQTTLPYVSLHPACTFLRNLTC